MAKVAIIILTGTDSHADLGRLANGLQSATEFVEHEDELRLIFDGAGTQWIPELESSDHDYHALYDSLRESVTVCDYCSNAFGVADEVDAAGLDRVDEFEGHPSIRSLVADGYEVITF